MSMEQLQALMDDRSLACITMRQEMRSDRQVEDGIQIVYPPTYNKEGSDEVVYNVVEIGDGHNVCVLDSVQSQANRIEEAFLDDEWNALIPRVTILARNVKPVRISAEGARLAEALGILGDIEQVQGRRLDLLQLPHRLGDATLRMSRNMDGSSPGIHRAFLAFGAGDAVPIARISPFSLLFGVWDSRVTQIKVPRAIAGEILARDVARRRKMAYFLAPISADDAPAIANVVSKPSEVGFDNAGDVDNRPDGVYARGPIIRDLTLNLVALRDNCRSSETNLWPYLFGLAALSLVVPTRAMLRQGCTLLPAGTTQWQLRRSDGAVNTTSAPAFADARALAERGAKGFFGASGPARMELVFDAAQAAQVFETAANAKAAAKGKAVVGKGRRGKGEK